MIDAHRGAHTAAAASQAAAGVPEAAVLAVVAGLRLKDAGTTAIVESFAQRLSCDRWEWAVAKLERRRGSARGVDDDAATFVFFLKIALREQARRQAEMRVRLPACDRPRGHVERVKREDPERYVRTMFGVPGFDVDAYLVAYVSDAGERERLRGLAA